MSPLFRRGAVAAALSVLIVFSCANAALAAKGGRTTPSTSSAFSLASDYTWNSPNPSAPTWCINEDDIHQRTWTGSLNGTFTATERLCDPNSDYSDGIWWDAGGDGLQADLYVTGSLNDLTITSPNGDSHHAVLIDSSTSKGVRTDHYQVCYVPSYSPVNDVAGASLPGGTWQIALSGSLSSVRFKQTADMTNVEFQQRSCPPSQQNINP